MDFDASPDFSEYYFLGGNDQSAIHHAFSSRVLEYFERPRYLFGLSVEGVEGRDGLLRCYSGYRPLHSVPLGFRGARVEPDHLKLFLDEGRAVFDLFRMKP